MTGSGPELEISSDHDSDVWVVWTPGDGPGWARREAALCFSGTEDPYDDDQVDALAHQLEVVAEHLTGPLVAAAFVHLPAPAQGSGFVVTVQLLEAGEGTQEALVVLATGGRQGLAAPSVEPFAGALGDGLRVQQHVEAEDGTVLDTLTYLWHRPDLGAQVRVGVSSAYLGELLDAEDEVEELVRGLDVRVPD